MSIISVRMADQLGQEFYQYVLDAVQVGIFQANLSGDIIYANEAWWRIFGMDKTKDTADNWVSHLHEDVSEVIMRDWKTAVSRTVPIYVDFAVRRKDGSIINIQWNTQLEKRDGLLIGFIGTAYEITQIKQQEKRVIDQFKKNEENYKARILEAEKVKDQQELYIKLVTQQLKGPTDAQNTDQIRLTAQRLGDELDKIAKGTQEKLKDLMHILDNDLNSYTDITSGIKLQQTITDDARKLSQFKLNEITLRYIDFNPSALISSFLNIYKNELDRNQITVDYIIDSSVKDNKADCITADSARLTQIINNILVLLVDRLQNINERHIKLVISSKIAPYLYDNYVDSESIRITPIGNDDVYLYLTFEYNGKALENDVIDILQNPFSRTSLSSYNKLESTGLSLFISKAFIELMGGELNIVENRDGTNHKLEFFIRASRSTNCVIQRDISTSISQLPFTPNLSPLNIKTHPPLTYHQLKDKIKEVCQTSSTENELSERLTRLFKDQSQDVQKLFNIINWDHHNHIFKSRIDKSLLINIIDQILPTTTTPTTPTIQSPPASPSGQSHIPKSGPQNLKILVVEDNKINQKIFKRHLELAGHNVTLASNGAEALEAMERQTFDIVFLDIAMPVLNGLDTASRIRELEEKIFHNKKKIPIIAVTGYTKRDYFTKALDAGMTDMITKPYEPSQIYDMISKYYQPPDS